MTNVDEFMPPSNDDDEFMPPSNHCRQAVFHTKQMIYTTSGGGAESAAIMAMVEQMRKERGVNIDTVAIVTAKAFKEWPMNSQCEPLFSGAKFVYRMPLPLLSIDGKREADDGCGDNAVGNRGNSIIGSSRDPNQDGAKPSGGCTPYIALSTGMKFILALPPPNDKKNMEMAAKELLTLDPRSISAIDVGGDSLVGSIEHKNMDAQTLGFYAVIREVAPWLPQFLLVVAPCSDGESSPQQMIKALHKAKENKSLLGRYPHSDVFLNSLKEHSKGLMKTRTPWQILNAMAAKEKGAKTFAVTRVFPSKRTVTVPLIGLLENTYVLSLNRGNNASQYYAAALEQAHMKMTTIDLAGQTGQASSQGSQLEKDAKLIQQMSHRAFMEKKSPLTVPQWIEAMEKAPESQGKPKFWFMMGMLGGIADREIQPADYTPVLLPPKPGHEQDKDPLFMVCGNKEITVNAWNSTDAKDAGVAAMAGFSKFVKMGDKMHPKHFMIVLTKHAAERAGGLYYNAALATPSKDSADLLQDMQERGMLYVEAKWGKKLAAKTMVHATPDATMLRLHLHFVVPEDEDTLGFGHAYFENWARNIPGKTLWEWLRGIVPTNTVLPLNEPQKQPTVKPVCPLPKVECVGKNGVFQHKPP